MGLEELAVILMTNLLECYIWNLFMRNFFDYRSMPVLTRNMARFGIVAVMSLINLVGSPPLILRRHIFCLRETGEGFFILIYWKRSCFCSARMWW